MRYMCLRFPSLTNFAFLDSVMCVASAARILCVADVYDALTTARSYRDSMSHARAATEMRTSHGQFDPELLEAFLSWAETADVRPRPTPQRVAVFTMDHLSGRVLPA